MNPSNKISKEKLTLMREMLKTQNVKSVAIDLGVSMMTVYRVKRQLNEVSKG